MLPYVLVLRDDGEKKKGGDEDGWVVWCDVVWCGMMWYDVVCALLGGIGCGTLTCLDHIFFFGCSSKVWPGSCRFTFRSSAATAPRPRASASSPRLSSPQCVGLLSMLDSVTPYWFIYVLTIIEASAVSLVVSATSIAVQAALRRIEDVAVATSLASFFRAFGGAFGLAVSATAVNNALAAALAGVVPEEMVQGTMTSARFVRALPPDQQSAVISCWVTAIQTLLHVLRKQAGS
ncbi:hypothetical protein BC938DRAFT_480784 [Jimgerdemannia flammicorona]|uniref:Uncharacterized protein n=1 Tax=Jimgerdemannia flammicorona TaxID=994334 RepID=A0A433QHN2_9FUNG|nr:hypothetical protein BC938DRAFT_480784 [Jimgerdemannia flammicorona]